VFSSCYFFFQAEDGIRDRNVTGVQTCALPISWLVDIGISESLSGPVALVLMTLIVSYLSLVLGELVPKRIALARNEGASKILGRSEERRVGKEGRGGGWAGGDREKKVLRDGSA